MNSPNIFLQEKINLSDQKIYVFLIQLDFFKYDDFLSCLSDNERKRANKLKVEDKKRQFVITRGILRQLLSNMLEMSPNKIAFQYGEHNKPFIDYQYNNLPIEFNVSHSGDYALIAVGLESKLGVDIEIINHEIDYQSLSHRFFSKKESKLLMEINESEQLDAFYRIWTRKEAFIKAVGDGVAFGLGNFSVSFKNEKMQKIEIDSSKSINDNWYCSGLMNTNNYKTAITTNSKEKEIIFFQQVK